LARSRILTCCCESLPDSAQHIGADVSSKLDEVPADQAELRFGNSCYYVEFTERKHKGIYGHEYRFFLEDAVGDVPEYIVDWRNFES